MRFVPATYRAPRLTLPDQLCTETDQGPGGTDEWRCRVAVTFAFALSPDLPVGLELLSCTPNL